MGVKLYTDLIIRYLHLRSVVYACFSCNIFNHLFLNSRAGTRKIFRFNQLTSQLFVSLQVPRYRLMWMSDIALHTAEFMEILILSWFILETTDSPLILGLFGALRFSGTLGAPFFGVFVDRIGWKKIFLSSRLAFLVFSLAIFTAAATDNLNISLILFMSVLTGLWRSVDMIVRQSILPEVVGSHRLQNGVALTRTGRDITQIFSPVLAGVLMDAYGVAMSYLVIVILYAVSLILIAFLSNISRYASENKDSVLGNLMSGLKYVRAQNFLMALLVIAFIVNLTAFPFNNALIAVIARDVFDTSATGLGWLMGAFSLGALLGSLVVGSFGPSRPTNKLMIAGSFLWHIAILLMAGMKLFYPSLPVLMLIGICQSFSMVTMAVMILQYTGYQMRGRVLGLRQLAVYGLPIGLLFSGFVADEVGVLWALVLNGTMGIALLGGVLVKWPQVLAYQFEERSV